jgi:hypothetical protein
VEAHALSAIFGPLGALTLVLLCTLAVLVLRARPEAEANRRLALVLALEGLGGGLALGLMYLAPTEGTARVLQIAGYGTSAALPVAYLFFLQLVTSPLSAPLRVPAVRWALLGVLGILEVLLLAQPELYLGAYVSDRWYAPHEYEGGPLGVGVLLLNSLVSLYGLAVGISAYRRAPRGTIARQRAKNYAIAFGARDALFTPLFVGFALFAPTLGQSPWRDTLLLQGPLVTSFIFGALLSYAILRTQIFDIDLRIKAGLSRSVIGACLVLAFLVGSRVAANVLNQSGVVAGGAAVGVMMFLITPVQKAAEGFANRALPQVQDTPEYLTFKKLEVYQAAVESAHELGADRERSRAFLDRLAETLAIRAEDRAAIEQDVAGRLASV